MSDPTVCPTCYEKVFSEDAHGCPTVQLKDTASDYTLKINDHGSTGKRISILDPLDPGELLDMNHINQYVEYITGNISPVQEVITTWSSSGSSLTFREKSDWPVGGGSLLTGGITVATGNATLNGIPIPESPLLPSVAKQPSSTCLHCWCIADNASSLWLSGVFYSGIKPHMICCACAARRLAE